MLTDGGMETTWAAKISLACPDVLDRAAWSGHFSVLRGCHAPRRVILTALPTDVEANRCA